MTDEQFKTYNQLLELVEELIEELSDEKKKEYKESSRRFNLKNNRMNFNEVCRIR